jgi:hypothetical protein
VHSWPGLLMEDYKTLELPISFVDRQKSGANSEK